MALRPMAIKPLLTGALNVRGHEQIFPPHVGQSVYDEIEYAWSVNGGLRNSCWLTDKREVSKRVNQELLHISDTLSCRMVST